MSDVLRGRGVAVAGDTKVTSPSAWTSAGMVTTVAPAKFSQAVAETRSSGIAAEPMRASPRSSGLDPDVVRHR